MKKKIIFASKIKGISDVYPIIPAKNYKWRWAEAMREDHKKVNAELKGKPYTHTFRCPGIFDIAAKGYIIPLPWDVTIETTGDGINFNADLPGGQIERLLETPPVDAHSHDTISRDVPKGPGVLKTVIKLHTPWQIIVPEGLKFLMLPIPYPDTFEFENFAGVLDSAHSSEVHIQLKWKKLLGRHTIKAGTPMAQLIPLSDEEFDLVVRDFTDEDYEWHEKKKYFHTINITRDTKLVARMYKKFFYDDKSLWNRIKKFFGKK